MITNEQFRLFDSLFSYYNNELFGGRLNDCMIITSRLRGVAGFFISKNWKEKTADKGQDIHEISLNPDCLDRADVEWQSTLVHEMVHLWQHDNGKPSRGNYHNRQWAEKMEEIGLMPSNTGQPGGKKTGQGMTHYIIQNGLFVNAFNRLAEKQIKYVSPSKYGLTQDVSATAGTANKTAEAKALKTKYSCPCGNNVWGKPALSIICAACDEAFEQAG